MRIFIHVLLVVICISCTVQQRKYRKGYYFSWTRPAADHSIIKDQRKPAELTAPVPPPETVEASAATGLVLLQPANGPDSCDVLLLKQGNRLLVKVVEVSRDKVKYSNCGDLTGEIFTLNTYDVASITDAKGNAYPLPLFDPDEKRVLGWKDRKNARSKTKWLAISSLLIALIASIVLYYLSILAGLLIAAGAICVAVFAIYRMNSMPGNYDFGWLAALALAVSLGTFVLVFFYFYQ